MLERKPASVLLRDTTSDDGPLGQCFLTRDTDTPGGTQGLSRGYLEYQADTECHFEGKKSDSIEVLQ